MAGRLIDFGYGYDAVRSCRPHRRIDFEERQKQGPLQLILFILEMIELRLDLAAPGTAQAIGHRIFATDELLVIAEKHSAIRRPDLDCYDLPAERRLGQ